MFLLIRTLSLIFGLAAGLVATATAQRGLTCPQEIPAGLIRDLWNRTNQLISALPKEKRFSVGKRLLPPFCTSCPHRVIGWPEMRELIDIYEGRVFSREVVQKLLPPHYNVLLHRLKNTLHLCVSSSEPSKWFKTIKKLGKKIGKQSERNERALKAVREFNYVLRWIDELAQHHIL